MLTGFFAGGGRFSDIIPLIQKRPLFQTSSSSGIWNKSLTDQQLFISLSVCTPYPTVLSQN